MANNTERYIWNLVDTNGQLVSLVHRPRLATDDIASLRIAALLDVGVALVPQEFVNSALQAARLQRLLPHLAKKAGLVHAIFPTRRGMVPAVRHLLDALVAGYENLHLNPRKSGATEPAC